MLVHGNVLDIAAQAVPHIPAYMYSDIAATASTVHICMCTTASSMVPAGDSEWDFVAVNSLHSAECLLHDYFAAFKLPHLGRGPHCRMSWQPTMSISCRPCSSSAAFRTVRCSVIMAYYVTFMLLGQWVTGRIANCESSALNACNVL